MYQFWHERYATKIWNKSNLRGPTLQGNDTYNIVEACVKLSSARFHLSKMKIERAYDATSENEKLKF